MKIQILGDVSFVNYLYSLVTKEEEETEKREGEEKGEGEGK